MSPDERFGPGFDGQFAIEIGELPNGRWVARCPNMPGCYGQGDTRGEAVESIRGSIAAMIMAIVADNLANSSADPGKSDFGRNSPVDLQEERVAIFA